MPTRVKTPNSLSWDAVSLHPLFAETPYLEFLGVSTPGISQLLQIMYPSLSSAIPAWDTLALNLSWDFSVSFQDILLGGGGDFGAKLSSAQG